MTERQGPLTGIRVIEIAGLGAGPYAAMLLADLGADVIRVDRPGTRSVKPEKYALNRGRRSITVDMKKSEGVATLLALVDKADVLFEGFRPGVAEKLGFGPEVCLERNPRLVYGRMTGWGQDGPMSQMAGHDLNYLGLTGALGMLARPGSQPAAPPGFVADMGGGGLLLAFGLVCAVLESRTTGAGQVVDAAMVDGVASMTTLIHSMIAQGRWHDPPGSNFCDGGSPYYDTYATSDGRYLAVAPIEPQFYAIMVDKLGLSLDALPDRDDPANWADIKEVFAGIFVTRTRAEWTELFDGTDACVTPVLSFDEAILHPHNVARRTFSDSFGVVQPSPAPRFAGSPGNISSPPPLPGSSSRAVLADWGMPKPDIDALVSAGVVIEG